MRDIKEQLLTQLQKGSAPAGAAAGAAPNQPQEPVGAPYALSLATIGSGGGGSSSSSGGCGGGSSGFEEDNEEIVAEIDEEDQSEESNRADAPEVNSAEKRV